MSLELGKPAPDFTLRDQNGQEVTLSSFRGQKNVVILFYPFTFTGVCLGELCTIRDSLPTFVNDDTITLAISCDTPFAQKVWSEQEGYGFPVLSDFWPHGATAKAYGIFDEARGCALRGTYIVDKEGNVVWQVEHAIGEARDAAEYEKVLATLS